MSCMCWSKTLIKKCAEDEDAPKLEQKARRFQARLREKQIES